MDVNQKQTVIALNQLIEVDKDSELACMTGASEVRNAELRDILASTAESCRASVKELQSLVSAMGGEPSDRGSMNGMLFRGWMAFRHMLSPSNDDAVLGMCEHEEEAARREYQSVMMKSLPPEANAALQRQYGTLMLHHDRLHAMRGMQIH
ncbi:PA2169 family four-helix-bundle protein [Cupriavidus sp. IDO]|jgi:uncharacterized protein (TIGR02284 family)|uniref:PA2169 family four-helix-bundle protein n=1 Tax=Cupriavidus sp. IDO TaxID=1539142 RepID=UPI00057906E3|nr:PA2169 family four-helix-bundle protein [Cupriavidus sp. IDO]KWR76676.1 hypothetical protein RM96_32560 [Cupriavidus sp. IDO]